MFSANGFSSDLLYDSFCPVFRFMCSGLYISLCLVIHFLLANVLYVLRITISNYLIGPFGILNVGRYSESVLMPCSATYILVGYFNFENGTHFSPCVLQFPFITYFILTLSDMQCCNTHLCY